MLGCKQYSSSAAFNRFEFSVLKYFETNYVVVCFNVL